MRFTVVLAWILLLCHCARIPESVIHPQAASRPTEPPTAMPQPAIPEIPPERPQITSTTAVGITFEGVAFDSRSHRLVVVDQPDGPGSEFPDAASAGRSQNGLAAANAGFFTPEGDPLGWVIAQETRSGTWNSASSLGSGVWHENPSGSSAITRRETLGRSAAVTMHELLQAGPLLVENGHTVSGLNPSKTSVRTMLLWDGGTRWWLGRSSACSLADLGSTLSRHQPAGWPIHHALNLDGGRSADLWISGAVTGGPLVRRAPWNRPVRNFLVLRPR